MAESEGGSPQKGQTVDQEQRKGYWKVRAKRNIDTLNDYDNLKADNKRLKANTENLSELLDRDPHFPELLNLQGFKKETLPLVEHVLKYDEEGFVLFLDVDNLKRLNDEHSHATGDKVLGELSRLLKEEAFKREEGVEGKRLPDVISIHHEKEEDTESLNNDDIEKNDDIYSQIARRTGDEFLVFFHSENPVEGIQYVVKRLERIRGHLENWSLDLTGDVKASFSYGIASIGEKLDGKFDIERVKAGEMNVLKLDKKNVDSTQALEAALEVSEARMYADKIERKTGRT